MLRFLIGAGLLLMTLGFGAAGWQYWQGLPATPVPQEAAEASVPAPVPVPVQDQGWMISATGGLVPRDDVRAYLSQDRFVPGRMATVVRSAPLTTLLADGERLPAAPFLSAFADIRAPKLAEDLCPVLLASIAQDCAVHAARVVDGSVDPVQGMARFRIELAYTLKPEEAALPDLATHVFVPQPVVWDVEAGAPDLATVETALAGLIGAALAACAAEDAGEACRVLGLSLNWAPGTPVAAEARTGWLVPLPEGVLAAPSLDPAPEG